jgi:hypothetical protein
MKIVYFKIKGERFTRGGPCYDHHTIETITSLLARLFKVDESFITILELS